MKRIAAFFFLLVVLYNTAGYYLVVKVKRAQLKEQVKQMRLETKNTSALTLIKESKSVLAAKQSKLAFIDKNEFKLNGEMYDVLSMVDHGDEVWFYCISDKQEDKLLTTLEQLVNENGSATSNNSKQLLKSLLKEYLPLTEITLSFNSFPVNSFFVFNISSFHAGHILLMSPPPEFIG